MEDGPVFSLEILIEEPIKNSVEGANEIGYEMGCKIKPFKDLAYHLFWTHRHQVSEHVDRAPAYCKKEEDHEHG